MFKRIGILGGTFDPPHLGHLVLAQELAEELKLDRVLFIPSAVPPHKDISEVSSAKHRFEMTKRATKGNKLFSVSDIELKRKGPSYTVDTIRELKKIYPQSELFFLTGSDILEEILKWKDPQEIYRQIKIVIGLRPGFDKIDPANQFVHKSQIIEITSLNISSTLIREKIKKGKSIKYLVPPEVLNHIKDNKLYCNPD
ncbi:MAG: nicotinate-nucleotide adenylyltransferase [candidate division Zixibacteria bacterium]|nr:nicotinate-nucleotide adenylyltransferase [candidate division Zixibacteria bacterium]